MTRLGDLDIKIRSKNAGPFWITADIFCRTRPVYDRLGSRITEHLIAACLDIPADSIIRFDIEKLNVVKFSLPRPDIQGSRTDRDMHGAQLALRLAEIEIKD